MLFHFFSYVFSTIATLHLITLFTSTKLMHQDIEKATPPTQAANGTAFTYNIETTPPAPLEEMDDVNHDTDTDANTKTTVIMGPGTVDIPILLYHHVLPDPVSTSYSISVKAFEEQMQILSCLGYETITTTQLQEAIIHGAELPAKPILLTFDDGNINNFTFAYPIMRSYGFSGTIYIVANRLNAEGFVNASNLQEMIAAGWEIGSHTYTHPDLTEIPGDNLRGELLISRTTLEETLNTKVVSLAYPFGQYNQRIADKAEDYGYMTAMGLGNVFVQDVYDLYYLARYPMDESISHGEFLSILGHDDSLDNVLSRLSTGNQEP
jgi:peptidoglycan/xylan/chitin deacetylase (PgdA/CDA1 family)